jgi:uncharacterized Zn finger protein
VSGWDGWDYPRAAPKRPAPAYGIRVRKVGATWWGKRWIEALEAMSAGYSSRLSRGKTYARAGRTHDLVIKPGEVTARVTGSRPTPYKVRITLAKLGDATWEKAVAAMARKAQFAADLLAGQMPEEIDAVFRATGASLFPANGTEVGTNCTCPDWANPCKHAAATHYVLGEAFDRDPFLLFELRGRTKEQVLEALRAARTSNGGPPMRRSTRGPEPAPEADVPSMDIGKIDVYDYDRPRRALPALHLSFQPPAASGLLLKQLGAPPAWSHEASPADMLTSLVRAASEKALRLALGEAEAAGMQPEKARNAKSFRRSAEDRSKA